jgi:hypothetical protein
MFKGFQETVKVIDKKDAKYIEKFRLLEKDVIRRHENLVKL